jgi:hypothetical protein
VIRGSNIKKEEEIYHEENIRKRIHPSRIACDSNHRRSADVFFGEQTVTSDPNVQLAATGDMAPASIRFLSHR